MKKTIYICDRCRKEMRGAEHFWGSLTGNTASSFYCQHPRDLCQSCFLAVLEEIQRYARKNRLRLLVTEGIIVKE